MDAAAARKKVSNEEQQPRLLMIEDNPGDAFLFARALRDAGFDHTMTVASNGDKALAVLKGEAGSPPRPDLVILDLNLPGKSGHEVLREMKESPDLRGVPVIVLSSSEAESDVAEAYDLHANCYIRKPVNLDETLEMAHHLASFWLLCVSLPRCARLRQRSRESGAGHALSDGSSGAGDGTGEERVLKRG